MMYPTLRYPILVLKASARPATHPDSPSFTLFRLPATHLSKMNGKAPTDPCL